MLYCRLLTRAPEIPCHHPPLWHAAHRAAPAAPPLPSPARFPACRMENPPACAASSWPTTTAARSSAAPSGPPFAAACSRPGTCAATTANMRCAGWTSWNGQRHRTIDTSAGHQRCGAQSRWPAYAATMNGFAASNSASVLMLTCRLPVPQCPMPVTSRALGKTCNAGAGSICR